MEELGTLATLMPLPWIALDPGSGAGLAINDPARLAFGHGVPGRAHPLWRDAWTDHGQREAFFTLLTADGAQQGFETRLRRFDGAVSWYSVAGLVIPSGGGQALTLALTDIAGLREAEERALAGEARFRDLVEGATLGTLVVTAAAPGRILYANAAAVALFGYDTTQQLAAAGGFDDLAALEEGDRLARQREARASGRQLPRLRFRARQPAGAPALWVDAELRPIRWNGVAAEQVLLRDATDDVQVERTLSDHATMLDTAMEGMRHGLVVTDADLTVIACNGVFQRQFAIPEDWQPGGFSFEQVLRRCAEAGDFGEGEEMRRALADQIALANNPDQANFVIRRANSTIYDVASAPRPEGGFVRTYTDVTEREQQTALARVREQEIAQKTALLEVTLQTMDQGLLVTDEDLNVVAYNAHFVEQFQLPATLVARPFTFYDIIAHRANSGDYGNEEQTARRVAYLIELANRPGAFHAEMERSDGRVFEVRNQPRPGGGFVRVYTDITARKRAEAELRASEQRLLTILETSPVAVEIVAMENRLPTGELLFFNRRLAEMLGHAGRTPMPWEILDRYGDDGDQDRISQTLSEFGQVRELELRWRRHDGPAVWVLATGWPLSYMGRQAMICWYYDITERKRAEAALIEAATTDSLSGAFNRRHFMDRAEQELRKTVRYSRPMSVLVLDIDHFKRINDTHGHATGDDAIRAVSRICRKTLRDADIFGRIGGEEFAAVLPETPIERATEAAERLRVAVQANKVPTARGDVQVTVSVGVATVTTGQDSVSAVLKRADDALYVAKRTGRNKVVREDEAGDVGEKG